MVMIALLLRLNMFVFFLHGGEITVSPEGFMFSATFHHFLLFFSGATQH